MLQPLTVTGADISILCADEKSTYFQIPGLDIWTRTRDIHNCTTCLPVITHAPCAQWSRRRSFAKPGPDKLLAIIAWEFVQQNGGIFEHPASSSVWAALGADRKKMLSVDQCWWGFPGRKTTWLYFNRCQWVPFPLFTLPTVHDITYMHSSMRSRSPLAFNQWLVDCIRSSPALKKA